jgi:hypothetical protein
MPVTTKVTTEDHAVSKHNRERRRRRHDTIYLGGRPDDHYRPALMAFAEAHGLADRPGVHHVQVWHDADCRRPQRHRCTCPNGPELRLADGSGPGRG